MISSEEAFSIFGKWKEERPLVRLLVGVPVRGKLVTGSRWPSLRIIEISLMPSKVVARIEGTEGEALEFDFEGAVFEYGDTRETAVPPELTAGSWVCFLEAVLPSGNRVLFAELRR